MLPLPQKPFKNHPLDQLMIQIIEDPNRATDTMINLAPKGEFEIGPEIPALTLIKSCGGNVAVFWLTV